MMITPDFLQRQHWRFGRSDGNVIVPSLEFLPDGDLRPSGSAEAKWTIENGTLSFLTDDGEESTKFFSIQRVAGGGCRLTGRFLLNLNLFSYHFLDNIASTPPLKESRLNVSMSLTQETDTLMVIFNSAGQPVEGRENRWEFYRLPDELGLDVIRFAEARSPVTFYLDKTQFVRRVLASTLQSRLYRRVIMIGMSSGAYAAILMAELMCSEFEDVEFHTFCINPQAAHTATHRQFITRYTEFGWTPVILTDYALSLRDCGVTDLSTLMATNEDRRQNVAHSIYFDAGNISEAYHASLIGGQAGVTLYPQELGLPHHASCTSMFEQRIVQDAVAALILVPPGGKRT